MLRNGAVNSAIQSAAQSRTGRIGLAGTAAAIACASFAGAVRGSNHLNADGSNDRAVLCQAGNRRVDATRRYARACQRFGAAESS